MEDLSLFSFQSALHVELSTEFHVKSILMCARSRWKRLLRSLSMGKQTSFVGDQNGKTNASLSPLKFMAFRTTRAIKLRSSIRRTTRSSVSNRHTKSTTTNFIARKREEPHIYFLVCDWLLVTSNLNLMSSFFLAVGEQTEQTNFTFWLDKHSHKRFCSFFFWEYLFFFRNRRNSCRSVSTLKVPRQNRKQYQFRRLQSSFQSILCLC